jgi:two-component system CheB/CheR fusion protein
VADDPEDAAFESLIRYIQESRGVDFRGYKRTSLRRRIALRMERVGSDGFRGYHAFLEAHPQEFGELLNTVLINVTSFFREPEAWDALKTEVLPHLLAERRQQKSIRVWSVGCASGEEPYSIAMLFAEQLGVPEFVRRVKIYATDLDEAALHLARHASYQPHQVEGAPPALLEKYFERTNSHYVVSRELRKSIIFGRHNIVHDAPISRIDLLVCRNLLIYLETDTQNVVLPRLHYALSDNGYLFLGKAETQLARSRLFRPINMKHRLFQKVSQEWRRLPGGSVMMGNPSPIAEVAPMQSRLLDAIIDNTGAACLVVDEDGVLVFANAGARRLLEVGEADVGKPFQDLAISYRPTELRTHIDEARRLGRSVRLEHQDYNRRQAEPMRVTIDLTPLLGTDGKCYAVLLNFTDTTKTYQLQRELEATQESLETTVEELQSTNEELETTNEELQSTNEELETTNEELQSTNEELETTNEELRSTNEELETANEELRRQSDEAAYYRLYSESVLGSIGLGIIVLDQNSAVVSWNRWNENTWGLREEDVAGQVITAIDIGLPAQALKQPITEAIVAGKSSETIVHAMDRRGRPIACRVRIIPLQHGVDDKRGAVLTLDNPASHSSDAGTLDDAGSTKRPV